ncbi:hypothetical protein RND71_011730 [Anisodus tanguticus]|uniref:Transcription elongation factor Eaf N-terminal domain-containing protein n=1 Tax=Anisodus tanguticus TaxID=243964 RepID=A0AAE1SEI1_9SOLA|nr:hypothetical protein RND71_011730 [Anisodus tanguticus]
MANINNKEEPSTAPQPDQWYNLSLGSSFKDHQPSSKFCTLRYEFKPASIDKNQPGKLHKTTDNKISVEFQNNQPGKPKVAFDGSSEDYKENDAVLFFDGESFRLERLHRAVKRLRYNRLPGESASAAAPAPAPAPPPAPAPVGMPAETSSPRVAKGAKFQSLNKPAVSAVPVEVERIEIGDFRSSTMSSQDSRPKNEKIAEYPSPHVNQSTASPDMKYDDLDEELDILNDDEDDAPKANGGNITVKEFETGIDINIPHQNDTDDEIADVDVSDDDEDKGRNAAEELRAQVNAEVKEDHTSSSSSSSGSDSSGSGSGSGSDSASSSSDNESSDTVNSI